MIIMDNRSDNYNYSFLNAHSKQISRNALALSSEVLNIDKRLFPNSTSSFLKRGFSKSFMILSAISNGTKGSKNKAAFPHIECEKLKSEAKIGFPMTMASGKFAVKHSNNEGTNTASHSKYN